MECLKVYFAAIFKIYRIIFTLLQVFANFQNRHEDFLLKKNFQRPGLQVLDDSDDDSMIDDVDDALALLAVGGQEAAVAEAPEEDDELLATYKEIMQLSIKKETSRGANFPAAKVIS